MNAKYVAGFFDGEGSAMVLTIRRRVIGGILYRFRPSIKLAQGTRPVLEAIREWLGHGTVVGHTTQCKGKGYFGFVLQINGNRGVRDFVKRVAPHCFLKGQQLFLLLELVEFQDKRYTNAPYKREDIERMIALRDAVFAANTWSKSRIKQKYLRAKILEEHRFVNHKEWCEQRNRVRIAALRASFAARRKHEQAGA